MTSKDAEKSQVPADTLKRAFECAVNDIYRAGLTGKVSPYRTPIVQRAGTAMAASSLDAKRAVSDAAKALAQLWKVSPNSSR
jgi:hypothetical protein